MKLAASRCSRMSLPPPSASRSGEATSSPSSVTKPTAFAPQSLPTGVNFILQPEQRGTGHALMVAQSALAGYDHVIVLSGDAPLITPETIGHLLNFHLEEQAAMTLLSCRSRPPHRLRPCCPTRVRAAPKSRPSSKRNPPAPHRRRLREINAGFYVFAVQAAFRQHRKPLHRQRAWRVLPHRHGGGLAQGQAARRGLEDRELLPRCSAAIPAPNSPLIDQQMRLAKCLQLMADGVTDLLSCHLRDRPAMSPSPPTLSSSPLSRSSAGRASARPAVFAPIT